MLNICVHHWLLTVTYEKGFFDGKVSLQFGAESKVYTVVLTVILRMLCHITTSTRHL